MDEKERREAAEAAAKKAADEAKLNAILAETAAIAAGKTGVKNESAEPAVIQEPAEQPEPQMPAKETQAKEKPAESELVQAEQKPAEETEKYGFKEFLFDAADLAESVITSVFIVMLILSFLFCIAVVEGDSMIPTLQDGDRLLVTKLEKEYENGEILILNNSAGYLFDMAGNVSAQRGIEDDGSTKQIVKRLIAQGGQQVDIDFAAGIVFVDGTALDEPYINNLTTRDNGAFQYPITVPEGYVFVLGDNRSVSKDSRHPEVGLVPVDDVVGAVIWRIYPLNKFGKVKTVTESAEPTA